MKQVSQFTLVTEPEQIRAASAFGLPLAHMAYRISNGPHLFRNGAPAVPHSGLMLIGEDAFDGQGEAAPFCQEVLRECQSRNFSGVVLDLDMAPTSTIARILTTLGEQLSRRGMRFCLPERYANYVSNAQLMVSSAISGGTLQAHLTKLIESYGAERLVLCLERSAEDFYLPAPQGSGRPLTRDELQQRIATIAPSIFFSNELCAHYFTYMSRDSGAHFILFDDVGSLRKKIASAEELGIHRFFLFYQQMDDILPDLLGK